MHRCQIDAAGGAVARSPALRIPPFHALHIETCGKAVTIAQCASRTTMISAPATGGEYMAEQQITPGTKLQVAFDVPMGQKTDFNMLATYKEDLDEAYFLMSAPMLAGKPLLIDENQKLLLQYQVGDVDKYTVVIWLDGDDPECVDKIIGGAVEFGFDFDSSETDDSSLFVKFVQDIADTLTGNDPISASGNEAPDYYKEHNVTRSNRRNQKNSPTGDGNK